MKNIVKALSMVLFAAYAVVGCEQPPQEEPIKVHLNKELISNLPVGSTQTLVATVEPEGADVTVVWSSDNESVAVVNEEGLVTGVAPGTAVITAAVDKETATCKVVVTAVKPTKIELNPTDAKLTVGSNVELAVIVTPSNAVLEDLAWSASPAGVVSVENGVVTALSVGKATVTAKCNGGELAAVCQVEVVAEEVRVSQIQMVSSLKLNEGEEATLEAVVLPEDATDKSVTFASDNAECATVDSKTGLVKAVKAGTATVTATANDGSGVSASCTVIVSAVATEDPEKPGEEEVKLESVVVTAEGNAVDLQVNLGLQLSVKLIPESYQPKAVSWYISQNSHLASVDQNGYVTGLSAGQDSDGYWTSAIVTVNVDGKESSHSLRVIPRQPDAIVVDLPAEGYIRVGQAWNFNPRVLPEGLGYTVYCSASLPNGRPHNEAYSAFVSDVPGEIKGIFAVSSHENLVYTSHRTEVSLPVKPYYVQTISLPETMEVEVGGSFILNPEFTSDVEGHEPTYKDVTWKSSDETKATVDSYGKVTALAAGTVQITATTSNGYSVPSGQAQKSATCTLTINAATVSINVGDYYYSDGTWSTELDNSKTVIGIVFARANSASSDALLAKDYPECVHGLVLSTEEYVQSCTQNRTWLRADLINWMSKNGYNQWLVDDKYCGYNNTQGLIALNAANVASGDGVIHVNHIDAVLQHREKVQSPAGASAWYMPSYLEMKELSANLDAVNASLEKIGGTTLRRTYEYVYDRVTGGTPIPTVGTAEQHYYYSNNVTENSIYAYNMNTDKLVNPKVSTSPWDSVSGEQTPLPVRVVLAF